MERYAKKQKVVGRILLAVAIISCLSFFWGIFLFSSLQGRAMPLVFLGFWISAGCFITYFVKFFWFGHTLKILEKSGFECCLDDIDLATPTFERAKIYCGKKAFFCKRTGSVVVYDQVAWIYSIGAGEYTIRLKNGKKAYIMIDTEELFALLNDYISPQNPKIIEGNTVQAKKEFFERYPEATPTVAKGKVIGGSALLAYALLGITVGLIKNTVDIGGFVVIGILGVVGLGFLTYGVRPFSIVSVAASVQDRLSHSVFFNMLCKIGSVLAVVCIILVVVFGVLKFEAFFIPTIIGYGIGMVFFVGSIFLKTGFFVKGEPTFYINLPDEMLDDTSFITGVSCVRSDGRCEYTFRLVEDYDWGYIRDSVDHLFACDLDKETFKLVVEEDGTYTNLTKVYLKGKKTGEVISSWIRERDRATVFGKSKTLKNFVSVVFYNQTKTMKLFLNLENEKIATAYIETLVRRSFGTPDQLKLATKNLNAKEECAAPPVKFEGTNIYVDSKAFLRWGASNILTPQYVLNGRMPLEQREPTIHLYEDGIKTREYVLQTENDEDFTGKYFLISVRLGVQGNPAVPVAQIDGFISDTPEERQMTYSDIGYRMEGHFLACGGESGKRCYEMSRGQDLPMKALKYPGYTTPSNVRLIGVCPDCGKSFCFHGYAYYMAQDDVAYSDDGLYCCAIQAHDIDKDTWAYETEGKVFRYYNSFNCPHCGTPYIDYKKYPENKTFGVSGCVLLGKEQYQFK